MAQSAFASGPIAFTSSTSGREIYVPLDVITIDASGSVALPSGLYSSADSAEITKWLQYLLSTGELVAVPAPVPAALDLVAAAMGPGGNGISVGIGYVPSTSTYTVTAKQTDFFAPLTPADVVSTVNGLAGGLIHVSAASGYAPPYTQTLTAASGELTTDSELVLATASTDPDAARSSVHLDPAGPSLQVIWTKKVTIVPPVSLPPGSGQKTQKEQIDAAFAFVSITSSPDVTASGTVVVPSTSGPTAFDATTNTLALSGASATALTLTRSSPPSSSDTNLAIQSVITAQVDAHAADYDLTITRTDTYSGANLTPDKLAAGLGTTGSLSTPPTAGTVTGGLVVVRTNGATPPSSFVAVPAAGPQAPLVVQAADGRFEIGLAPGSGLAITPNVSALTTLGTWSITASPTGSGTFSLEASWSNSGKVDTTQDLATQTSALQAAIGALVAPTPHALLSPQGGSYSLSGGSSTAAAKASIPARP